jgi:hypothetical protein
MHKKRDKLFASHVPIALLSAEVEEGIAEIADKTEAICIMK